jgi:hypothetical protein
MFRLAAYTFAIRRLQGVVVEPVSRIPLSRAAPPWVPAVQQRGEGIFLQLREDAVAEWVAQVAEHPRMPALAGAYRRWAHNTARTPNPRSLTLA